MKNIFQILESSITEDFTKLKKAYLKAALKFHPDKDPDNSNATAKFREIQEVWQTVDTETKFKYYLVKFKSKKEFPDLDQYHYVASPGTYQIVRPRFSPSEGAERMRQATYEGNIEAIIDLMHMGETTRPLFYLNRLGGIHPSHFNFDLMKLDKFKTRMSKDLFRKKQSSIISSSAQALTLLEKFEYSEGVRERCQIAELFFANSTPDLEKQIDENNVDHFLVFFVWLAMNNHASILNTDIFCKFIMKSLKNAAKAAQVAAIFGSIDFIRDLLIILPISVCRTVLSIAAASYQQKLLEEMVQLLEVRGLPLNALQTLDVSETDRYGLGSIDNDDTLFWAIRSENTKALEYLLAKGMNPNNRRDTFSNSYLRLAVNMQSIPLVKLLLEAPIPAKVDAQNILGDTPLHGLLQYGEDSQNKENIAYLLIHHKASLTILNKENKTPLDYVQQTDFKQKLLEARTTMIAASASAPAPASESMAHTAALTFSLVSAACSTPAAKWINELSADYIANVEFEPLTIVGALIVVAVLIGIKQALKEKAVLKNDEPARSTFLGHQNRYSTLFPPSNLPLTPPEGEKVEGIKQMSLR